MLTAGSAVGALLPVDGSAHTAGGTDFDNQHGSSKRVRRMDKNGLLGRYGAGQPDPNNLQRFTQRILVLLALLVDFARLIEIFLCTLEWICSSRYVSSHRYAC